MGRTINYRLSRDTFRWFDWVVYSSSEDGLFCKVCAMFEPFDSADRRGLVNIHSISIQNSTVLLGS